MPYLLLSSICACTEENVETVNDFARSQENKPQTHWTVREVSWETGIHRSSMSQIICKDLHLKCFKRRRAQELVDANCAARIKRANLLLQNFPSMPLTLFSLRMKRCSRSLHLTIGRTKSVQTAGTSEEEA